MTHPTHAYLDLSDEQEVLDTLKRAVASGQSLVLWRREIRSAFHLLHATVDDYGRNDLDELFEEHYVNLFDALGFLTAANRHAAFRKLNILRAIECLERNSAFACQS